MDFTPPLVQGLLGRPRCKAPGLPLVWDLGSLWNGWIHRHVRLREWSAILLIVFGTQALMNIELLDEAARACPLSERGSH